MKVFLSGRVQAMGVLIGLLSASLVGAPATAAYDRPARTEIVSLSSAEEHGRDVKILPVSQGCVHHCMSDISSDGRFLVFDTRMNGLVEEDNNETADVFLRDRRNGTTDRVSVPSDGSEPVGACAQRSVQSPVATGAMGASISGNGRFVVFSSCAANLTTVDNKFTRDVFVHDRKKGKTELISLSTGGEPALCDFGVNCADIGTPQSISANGRFVAFSSDADNLVEGDTNRLSDIFVRDRKRDTTVRVSVSSDGEEAQRGPAEHPLWLLWALGSYAPAMSDDGRYVAFLSGATNLVPGQPDNPHSDYIDVFVHDRKTGKTEQMDVDRHGNEEFAPVDIFTEGTSHDGLHVAISGDGRYVAFQSRWPGFVPNDNNNSYDIFVRDRKTREVERVSIGSAGTEPDAFSLGYLSLSRNARFVAFSSGAHIHPRDTEGGVVGCGARTGPYEILLCLSDEDVYLHDRATGATELVSMDVDGDTKCGEECEGWTWSGSMDASGRYVTFSSAEDELARNDKSDHFWVQDFFVRDRGRDLGIGEVNPSLLAGAGPRFDRTGVARILDPDADSLVALDGAAEIVDSSFVYRPTLKDLYVKIALKQLGLAGSGGDASLLYGTRFQVAGRTYEVRAAALPRIFGGHAEAHSFGLFECNATDKCHEIEQLQGGFGTIGSSVVTSVPLDALELDSESRIENVTTFVAHGSYSGGAVRIFDEASL